jgi:hypothetical protein
VLSVSVPLWIADSRNHDLPFAAMGQVGTALAYDDRLGDWGDAIVVRGRVWGKARRSAPGLSYDCSHALQVVVAMNSQASILALTCHT